VLGFWLNNGGVLVPRNLVGVAVAAAVVLGWPAVAAPTLLRCSASDYAALGEDGLLGKDNIEWWLEFYQQFVVDLSTGAMRIYGDAPPVSWQVIQSGSASYDWILTPGASRTPAHIATDYLRVRTWSNFDDHVPIRFFWVRLTQVVSGTCSPLE
jgi:hypothetical protein